MIKKLLGRCRVMFLVFGVASTASAQQRPLVTEDPETIGSGLVLIEGGIDYARDQRFPVSGLKGNLLRLPLIGFSIGVSSIAELQIDGLSYSRLSIAERQQAPHSERLNLAGDMTGSMEDLVVGTKVRLVSESARRPAFGLQFATRLPSTDSQTGLGLGTTDFSAKLLGGKTVQSVRVVGNVGVGILGDPVRGDRKNEVLLYGVSFARAVAQGLEIVGELNGRIDTRKGDPPPGTENRSGMRFGGRYTRGTIRVDAAVLAGLTSRDPSLGVTAGFTWVFQGFQIP